MLSGLGQAGWHLARVVWLGRTSELVVVLVDY